MRIHRVIAAGVVAVLLLSISACGEDNSRPEGRQNENQTRNDNYETLVGNQPSEDMSYSPTRETINGWIETWDEPGKLSYVYIQDPVAGHWEYYVFEGLPVSYCAMMTENYEVIWQRRSSSGSHHSFLVDAPAMDGVFYSECPPYTYYGFDAVTGGYMEFSARDGVRIFEEPSPQPHLVDAVPAGHSTIEDVEEAGLND